jgi:hypothetical protein
MARNYKAEHRAMGVAVRDQRIGTTMQTLGWVLIIFDLIPAVWLWVGWREGSWLWFWWVLGEAVIGGVLLIAGTIMRSNAARDLAAHDREEPGSRAA